jgi:protein tyrosine/serine phosphatase
MNGGAALALPIDLETPAGRRRARHELVWGDHGFLRYRFRNLHRISDEMYRANQPSPEHIARYAKELGLKTILNLRGDSPKGYYLLEKEACARHGIQLVDFQMFSREIPSPEKVLEAKHLFDSIAYPALMHCKSGADRAGIMAVLYMHFRKGLSRSNRRSNSCPSSTCTSARARPACSTSTSPPTCGRGLRRASASSNG